MKPNRKKLELDDLSPEFRVALAIYRTRAIYDSVPSLGSLAKELNSDKARVIYSLNKLSDWGLVNQLYTSSYALDETFQETIEKIYREIYDESDNKEPDPDPDARIYVPKEIGLSFADDPETDNPGGIGIINSLGQCLYKNINDKSFNVVSDVENDNRGDNFFYIEVKKPIENETYFVSSTPLHGADLFDIEGYRPYISNRCSCYWHDDGTRYDVYVHETIWHYYYRIEANP